eukprot:6450252-Prymnesium_polylepis.1
MHTIRLCALTARHALVCSHTPRLILQHLVSPFITEPFRTRDELRAPAGRPRLASAAVRSPVHSPARPPRVCRRAAAP